MRCLIRGPVRRYFPDAGCFVDALIKGFNPRFNPEDFTWLTEIIRGQLCMLARGKPGCRQLRALVTGRAADARERDGDRAAIQSLQGHLLEAVRRRAAGRRLEGDGSEADVSR